MNVSILPINVIEIKRIYLAYNIIPPIKGTQAVILIKKMFPNIRPKL